ncbi:M48 family metalloprotease [Psychrobacter sp. DAB_AL62B]|uniref:M48 family metalloprotease n=1 Tax=Psychrobacter sp. DAB_AL62B TaxID=1028420 RepID=UPI002380D56F|nr:M48 family metalloprotease [Psychrobacter sp. DAB_AL62B]MDE4454084.1 peptidase M48 [Psychrobacter sp. DAB_AL62B]
MDFFGEQRTRTQRSLLLYGLFFLIIFAHMAVALGVMALLLTLFTGGIYYWALILVIVWTIGSFVIGSFLEYGRLAAGGRAIAQRVGAVRLFVDHSQDAWEHSRGVSHQHEPVQKVRFSTRHIAVRDERDFPPVYRRYYEIAQQLAIASGLSMPILYVLPDEQGINGFVAGRYSQDMVLVVTQGALDKLSDEALYGLIGHEYGHILHGDATFNLQLMVVLAGLQLLYDWSDSVNNIGSSRHNNHHNYFDNAVNQNKPLPQRAIDSHARSTEVQTASFTTHSEWVTYWKKQSQSQQSSVKSQAMWLQNRRDTDRQAPRNIWTLLIHGLSFSSMASAQLIKHSFNRERELLADATSVQLTRSPAIMETLQAIHKDSLGSRLTGIADINGLSHFFFASSGADLGDLSWFATHPSLAERMSAINANVYQKFAVQVAKEKRVNQNKIKEIYEQRRLGDWGVITANSLSKITQGKTLLKSQLLSNSNKIVNTADNEIIDYPNSIINEKISTFNQSELSNKLETDEGLEFVVEADIIIDGRLQVKAREIGTYKLLKPWQAKPNSDLPIATLISIDDIQKVSLPQYILNHIHHPLGALALIETVMLCHQGRILSTTATYDLADIWIGIPSDKIYATTDDDIKSKTGIASDEKNLPHTIDHKLLEMVASIDRRLDNALIMLAIKQLSQHDLSENAINELRLKSESSHSNQSYQNYIQQEKCRKMLSRYQKGILELFEIQLTANLSKNFADNLMNEGDDIGKFKPVFTHSNNTKSRTPSILALWQALHLQQLLPVLTTMLNDEYSNEYFSWQQKMQAGRNDIVAQLDPSGQIFKNIGVAERSILTLLAYRLSNDAKGQMTPALDVNNTSVAHYAVDLRRQARLIDIDLAAVSEANLQWLLLTAQNLNSVQLLALLEAVPIFESSTADLKHDDNIQENQQERQQRSGQIDYNATINKCYAYNDYRQWLSTLHTAMLHDTIVSQDEYDCLTLLSEHWLKVRQLF